MRLVKDFLRVSLFCFAFSSEASEALIIKNVSELPVVALESVNARANLIAITGGNGLRNGKGEGKNYLLREANFFANKGINYYLFPNYNQFEKASYNLRMSSKRLERVKALVDSVAERNSLPIFLIGFSRGSIETLRIALSTPERVSGIILASGIYRKGGKGNETMASILGSNNLSVPTLVIHHRDDSCIVSPFNEAEHFAENSLASKLDLIGLNGGSVSGRECGPFHYHGFEGIERKTSSEIVGWMNAL